MFQIISDGGCDFSRAEVASSGVHVVPFYISLDHENYLKEGIDITREDYFTQLSTNKNLFPKTSQPNPQDYIDAYTPYLSEGLDILSLSISSKLSGSHASARIAIETLKEEFPTREIILIDSQNATLGQGLILKEIIKMRDAGLSLHEAAAMAEKVRETTHLYCTLDTLEYLKRGGRVGPTTAFVGSILGLRPILQVKDGAVSQLDNVAGKKKAFRLIESAMIEALKDNVQDISICIGHILNEEDAKTFKQNAEAALGVSIENPVAEIGATIGTHAGPGAFGFAYCKKYTAIS